MLRLISDQNFNGRILRGLRRRLPELALIRALDLGLDRVDDPEFLEHAADDDRIVLTHDVNTLPGFATTASARHSQCREFSSSPSRCPLVKQSRNWCWLSSAVLPTRCEIS